MNHPDNNSPLIGATIGGLAGIYKSITSTILLITWDGVFETAFYAIVGSAIGAIISFWVTRGLKRIFRK